MPSYLYEQEFLRPGTYHGHEVTKDDLTEATRNTNALISRGYSIPVFTKHKPPGADDGGPQLRTIADDQIDALENVGWVRDVLESDRYAAEVREREAYYAERGIRSVPATILQERHLISGGQPPEVFEQALRQLAGAT